MFNTSCQATPELVNVLPVARGFSDTSALHDPHATSRKSVAEVRTMPVPLVANARGERAPENPLTVVLEQALAHGPSLPSRLQRIGQGGGSGLLSRGDDRSQGEHWFEHGVRE